MNTVIPHKIMLYYLHDAITLYFKLYLGARGASYGCVTVHNIIAYANACMTRLVCKLHPKNTYLWYNIRYENG